MKNGGPGRFPAREAGFLLVCGLYLIWNIRDLPNAWLHSPFDRWGWLAFCIWIFPVVFFVFRAGRIFGMAWLWCGVAVTLAGTLLDLHFLKHAGFALACAGAPPVDKGRFRLIFWLVCALCWMPALGWALKGVGPFWVHVARPLLALISILPLLRKAL